MFGQGRPTISAWVAAILWLAAAHKLPAQDVRAPGDSLRIVTGHDPLIFAPGEQFTFDLQPMLEGVEPSTTIDIATTLTPARGRSTLWSAQQRLPVPVDGPAVATLHVPLPRQEGVYEIRLAVTRPPGFRERFFPGGAATPLVERSFQVVVLDAIPTAPASDVQWRSVLEIDPASPTWWQRLPDWTQIRRIPGISRRPLGSFHAVATVHSLGNFVELPPTPPGGEPHWQAYPLPLESIGTPHLLEIEYPNDHEQHLGISIVEPGAAGQGQFVSIGRDSGIYVEGLGSAERVEKHIHRLVFWPRTNAPLLLVTNQHPTAAARFGRVRVLKCSSSSIATEPWRASSPPPTGRLVAAYLSRPLSSEASGDIPGLDPAGGQNAGDWQTFYEGAVHLAEYLNYAGYNAAAVNIMADGGSILPSSRLQTTPLADIRPIGAEDDLSSADGLELMLRVFDRCGLALVPSLQFVAALPELESLGRGADPKDTGIDLVGPGGLTWIETHGTQPGAAAGYNLLDDRVQQAMLHLVGEIIEHYGGHPSFAGLAVQLSGRGCAVLPDLEWGLDDATVARFEQDTGIRLPDDGPDRFAIRQELLLGQHVDAWRAWRAAQITRFYQQLAELLRSTDGKRRLLLTTEELFSTPELAARFRPNVVAKTNLDRTMLDLGLDREALQKTPGIVLLPTRYVESMVPLVDRAIDLEINDAFAAALHPPAAALFYHPAQRHSLPSFDAQSPFESPTLFESQSTAHGAAVRRPYVAALVENDPAIVLDGGELVPLGQEDAVRSLRAVLQALPTTAAVSTRREQNLTVRTYSDREQTVCVVLNECPWQADVTLQIISPTPTEARPLVAERNADGPSAPQSFRAGRQNWTLQLAPYDVQAVRFDAQDIQIAGIRSKISEAGQQELATRMSDLRDRDLTDSRSYGGLENPGFEPTGRGGRLFGWQPIGEPDRAQAEFDATRPQDGKTCLYLRNQAGHVATIQSNLFATPPTGQLVMTVFVRGENMDPNSELRLVFETDGPGTPYRQFATLGGGHAGVQPLGSQWGYYAFRSEDLPLDSRGQMRVKFELAGAGEVWIDNVQLHDLLFPLKFYEHSEPEKLELVKLIHAADSALEDGRLSDCIELLEGYWPRFLTEYTPAVQPAIAARPPDEENAATETGADEEAAPPSVSEHWFKWPNIWKR